MTWISRSPSCRMKERICSVTRCPASIGSQERLRHTVKRAMVRIRRQSLLVLLVLQHRLNTGSSTPSSSITLSTQSSNDDAITGWAVSDEHSSQGNEHPIFRKRRSRIRVRTRTVAPRAVLPSPITLSIPLALSDHLLDERQVIAVHSFATKPDGRTGST